MGRLRMPKEFERRFWRLIAEGASTERAAATVGVSANTGERWFRDGGGMAPMTLSEPSGRYLTPAQRETIDLWWAEGWAPADIARVIGKPPRPSPASWPATSWWAFHASRRCPMVN